MANQLFVMLAFVVATCLVDSSQAMFHANNSLECHKNVLQELDDYLKELEMINNKRRFPETMEELHEACVINKKVTAMMTKLADKCMSGFTKNIMQVTIYSIRKSRKSLCKKQPTKEIIEFLDAGKCINGGKEIFQQCLQHTQANILSVKLLKSKERIPLICCEMVRAKTCLLEQAKHVKECTEKHVDTLQSRYSHVSGNSMNMACGDYNEDTDKCDYVHPPPNIDYSQPPKSFMMAALELMELFETDPELQVQ